MLKTKSVHSPIEKVDGLRILVTRFRGRGLPSDRYDVCMANLGPSEKPLKGVLAGKIIWREFGKRYREESITPAAIDAGNITIKNHGRKFTRWFVSKLAQKKNVTLLCHCVEEAKQCYRFMLRQLVEQFGCSAIELSRTRIPT